MAAKYKLRFQKKPTITGELIARSEANGVLRGSVDKVRRVIDLIRGRTLEEAMQVLYFNNFAQANDVAKLIKSAAANAINLGTVTDLKQLVVAEIWAGKSFELRRAQPGPRGKVMPLRKRHSRLFVKLSSPLADATLIGGES